MSHIDYADPAYYPPLCLFCYSHLKNKCSIMGLAGLVGRVAELSVLNNQASRGGERKR